MSDMARVNRSNKCPICDHDTWCLVGKSVVICMRVQSPKAKNFKGGEIGWIHECGDTPLKRLPSPPQKKVPVIDARKVLADWVRAYPNDGLPVLAKDLGVSQESLTLLECTKGPTNTWGFPMKDGYGGYIGIRIRSESGAKWAVNGSQAGIFIPAPRLKVARRVFVVEGPTDCAAALTLGLYAVGRPSCSGGVQHIMAFVRKNQVQEVVVVCDNDDPGIRGGSDLQRMLPVSSCLMVLPTKDMREFCRIAGKEDIDSMISALVWTNPRETTSYPTIPPSASSSH